jgi:hypothetical protein
MAPPGSRPGSSARPGSAGVLYHHHHSANGKAAAAVVAAKVPGTPSRREQSHRLEKAVQDPGLKDYVGGDLLLSFFLSFFLFRLRLFMFDRPVLAPNLSVSFHSLLSLHDPSLHPYLQTLPDLHLASTIVRWLGSRPRGSLLDEPMAAGAGVGGTGSGESAAGSPPLSSTAGPICEK